MISKHKVAAVGALAAAALVLAACTTDTATGTSTDGAALGTVDPALTEAPAEAQVGDPTADICDGSTYRIGINIYSTGNTFGKDVIDGAKATASDLGCIDPVVLTDEFDAQKVVPNVTSLIQQQVNAVALLTATAAPFQQAVTDVQNAGLPLATAVIGADTAPLVDVNFEAAGEEGGAGIAEVFAKKFPGVTPYAIFGEYNEGGDALIDRMTGVQTALQAAFPNMTDDMILRVASQADPTTAGQGAVSSLSIVPAGTPVITVGMNDDIGYAMLQAVLGTGRDALGLGMGGDSGAQPLVCEGTYFTDGWFPEKTFDYIYPVLLGLDHGLDMPARIYTKTAFLSSETVNDYYPGTC